MKLAIVAILALAMVGCSAFNGKANRRIVDDCRNCYYYDNGGPQDPVTQTMRSYGNPTPR